MRWRLSWQRSIELLVLCVLLLAILWKGGKGLDAVWLTAFLGCGVTLMSAFFWRRKDWPNVPPLLWWSVLGFLLCTYGSFLASSTRNYGFDELMQTVSLALILFWTVRWSARSPTFQSHFFKTVSLALLVACFVGIVVYVFQPVNRFVGTFFDYRFHTDYWPNAWAEMVLFAWPLLLAVLWSKKRKVFGVKRELLKTCVMGLVVGCLFLSYSRGGIIAFTGQLILLAVLALVAQKRHFPWRRILKVGVASFLVALLVFAGINHVRGRFHMVESVTRKATFSSDEGSSSISERAQFWFQAVVLTNEHPFLGWGPYSFRFVQPHAERSVLATSDHPHNVFLKIAMERGLPAAIFFIIMLVTVLWTGIRKFLKTKELGTAALLVAVGGVLAHNLIDYNLQFVGIVLPLWMAFGFLAEKGRGADRSQLLYRGVEVTLAVTLFVIALFEGTLLFDSSIARRAEAKGDYLTALRWYERTNAAIFPRDQWLARGVILLSLGRLPEAQHAVDEYLKINEQDARAWRLLGDIYLKGAEYGKAFGAYTRAYAFGRYNDIGITRGFVYVSAHSKSLGARRKEVDQLMNEFGLAIAQNTHFIALSKNVEDLASLCDVMAQLYPQDAHAYRALARETTIHAKGERERIASRSRGLLW